MSDAQNEIDVYESRCFEKDLKKLPDSQLEIVEDEIEKIIENPELGEQKKGDLAHLRVHKFRLGSQLALLGYAWVERKLELYLLHLGSHENFYTQMKKQRKANLKLLDD